MSVLVGEKTKLIVQGITGNEGSFHARRCRDYGTKLVGGVTPGKGGTTFDGVPVFNGVEEAVKATGANTSLIFIPPAFAADGILEAIDAGVPLVICITEGIPTQDMIAVHHYLQGKKTRLIGPNCPGVITPGKAKVGLMPGDISIPGDIGLVSRSGTLTYEAVVQLTELGLGQSSCVGIGGDPLLGTTFVDVLKMFEKDPETKAVVLIGEIGGTAEQEAAEFIKKKMTKPVAALVVGASAPPGRRMGHAGAIISGSSGKAENKIAALKAAGATIIPSPGEIGVTVQRMLGKKK